MEQVSLLTNKIYREILCIKTNGSIMMVALNQPDYFRFNIYTQPSQYKILLSWELLVLILMEDRIPSSFTHFITTPELSGSLYISPDVYHTLITEYTLEAIFRYDHNLQCALFFLIKYLFLIASLLDLFALAFTIVCHENKQEGGGEQMDEL